jgi:hypothetical protein
MITVAAAQQRAFEVFTAQLGRRWPQEFHIGEADMADFDLEPKWAAGGTRVGGHGLHARTSGMLNPVAEAPIEVSTLRQVASCACLPWPEKSTHAHSANQLSGHAKTDQ